MATFYCRTIYLDSKDFYVLESRFDFQVLVDLKWTMKIEGFNRIYKKENANV